MIRKATPEDLADLLRIYRHAREFMRRTGNASQWGTNFPPQSLLESDIAKQQLYVCTDSAGQPHGVFALVIGEEPDYQYIEGGSWKSAAPYGTIHRLASDGTVHGVFSQCLAFCRAQIPHLRIDTHKDNLVMQHLIEKHGFSKCGIVYVRGKNPRIAYEL